MMAQGPVKILYIEDDEDTAITIKELLERHGKGQIEIEWSARFIPALSRVREWKPDLILLDLDLPDSNKASTVPRMLEQALLTPIVVFSGLGPEEEIRHRAISQGAIGFVPKPLHDAAALVPRLVEWAALGRLRKAAMAEFAAPLDEQIQQSRERIARLEEISREYRAIALQPRCINSPDCARFIPAQLPEA